MRISEGVSVFQLAANMGTSVEMIESFYGKKRMRDPKMATELFGNSCLSCKLAFNALTKIRSSAFANPSTFDDIAFVRLVVGDIVLHETLPSFAPQTMH
jgi:hypothetical protein